MARFRKTVVSRWEIPVLTAIQPQGPVHQPGTQSSPARSFPQSPWVARMDLRAAFGVAMESLSSPGPAGVCDSPGDESRLVRSGLPSVQ